MTIKLCHPATVSSAQHTVWELFHNTRSHMNYIVKGLHPVTSWQQLNKTKPKKTPQKSYLKKRSVQVHCHQQPVASVHYNVLWTQLDWSFNHPVYIMMCCELSLTEASTTQCTSWCAVNSAWLKLQPASVHHDVLWTQLDWSFNQPVYIMMCCELSLTEASTSQCTL